MKDYTTRAQRMHKTSKIAPLVQRIWNVLLGRKIRIYNSVTGRTTFIRVR